MNQIQLQVNTKNLINNMRFAFTTKQTVISELMQNARRAGSDFVSFDYDEESETLVIEDAGCGIDDPQKILSVAESGWDNDTMENETPYGIGFLSALFMSDRVSIESNQMKIEFSTDSVLSFNMVGVHPSNRRIGTRIELKGIRFDVERAVRDFSTGYPIKVYYNGKEMKRPHAENGELPYIETPIGKVHLMEYWDEIDKDKSQKGTMNTEVYLQGIKVMVIDGQLFSKPNIIHLNPKQFFGRAPDRDKLIDESEASEQIKRTISALWEKKIRREVFLKDDRIVAEYFYETLYHWKQLHLLNHIDYVPRQVLGCYDIYPIEAHEYENTYSVVSEPIAKQDILSGKVKILEMEDECRCAYEGFQGSMYAYYLEAIVLISRSLDADHWLYEHLVKIGLDDITVNLKSPRHYNCSYGDWYEAEAVFCHHAVLSGPCGDVKIYKEAFYHNDGFIMSDGYPAARYETDGLVVIPEGEHTGDVVRQLSSYMREWDFAESDYEMDKDHFVRFLMANRPGQEIQLIQRELGTTSLNGHESLKGKTFKVTVLPSYDAKNSTYFKVEME